MSNDMIMYITAAVIIALTFIIITIKCFSSDSTVEDEEDVFLFMSTPSQRKRWRALNNIADEINKEEEYDNSVNGCRRNR